MKSLRSWLLGLALGVSFFFGIHSAIAQTPISTVPRCITYQGVLEENGMPFTGTVQLDFYFSDSAGNSLYHQTLQSVPVADGIFNVLLGDPAKGGFPASMTFNEQYEMEIDVNSSNTLAPQLLWSAPYAINTQLAGGIAVSPTPVNGDLFPMPLNGSGQIDESMLPPIPDDLLQSAPVLSLNNTVAPNALGDIDLVGSGGITVSPGPGNEITISSINSAGIGGSGTFGTIPVWTGTALQGNSHLTDTGSLLSYSGANINTDSSYQINGTTILTLGRSTSSIYVGAGAGETEVAGSISNTFIGSGAGIRATGSYNTLVGLGSGSQSSGDFNTFIGLTAGTGNTSGNYNTFYGAYAGQTNATGSNNTAIGYSADMASGALGNATAIGNQAVASASNSVRIGNSSVTSIGGYANWSNLSDGRFKKNVQNNVPGLEFINLLTPITYNLDVRSLNRHVELITSDADEDGIRNKESIVYSGFIAQDVETAAESIGYNFDGVGKPQSDKDHYTLAYASFVPSLVKSVQELNATIASQQATIEKQEREISKLDREVELLEAKMDK